MTLEKLLTKGAGDDSIVSPPNPIYAAARWTATLFIVAAIGLAHRDSLHGARAALQSAAWQLDECLFVLLVGALGCLLASQVKHRQVRREAARRADEQRAARALALHDPLTGLLNRRGLQEIAAEPDAGAPRLLFLADLNEFKKVNDTHGHGVGDDVLRLFADRLRGLGGALGASGTRLGGDEFVFIASGDPDHIGEAVGRLIASPLRLNTADGLPVCVEVSAGMVQWQPGLSLDVVLHQADLAMYEAKRIGAGLCRFDGLPSNSSVRPAKHKRVFERQLAAARAPMAQICVAAVSLNRYHAAKRTLGEGFAARLFRSLREQLEAQAPALLIERLGPDSMGILFAADDIGQAMTVVETLGTLASQAQGLDGTVVEELLTVGVAGPAPASCLRETVEQAQFALDEARRTSRRHVVFDPREQHRAAQNVRLMTELRDAISGDRLALHYQPKMSCRTGEIDSFEALVRWPHAERGAISPGEFVPIAEASGDIEALTFWVIERALADWAHLDTLGMARPIYVNVSAQLVGAEGFAKRLLAMLAGQGERIGIEITETAVLSNPEHALTHLRQLANAGINIAIDDYGVGLSSLAYLKQLPATELKIDMMFITHLADSHRDPMIVRSTIDLAHGLGLRVTAEGVDKAEALTLLKIMGCDMIQGYHIAAAMPLPQLTTFMKNHDSSAEHVPDYAAQFLALVSG
ncbi:MAG: phosphodiesterase [Sphingomonas bacterium]|nr:phosphodiesterase [Sphingomonas bacterium]